MTCESALELLLDAEPSEFSANESTPLGAHLRGCVRCRRVAAQLMQDTQRLAVAMEAAVRVRRPTRGRHVTLLPAFAMAALVFAVVLRERPEGASIASVKESVETVAPSVPATIASPAVNAPIAPARASRGVRHEMRSFARAVPLAPVRLVSSNPSMSLSVASNGVTVTPPPGTRATVMHISNPKLVVVWLH